MKKKVSRETVKKIVVAIILVGFFVYIIGNRTTASYLKIVGEVIILSSIIPVIMFWRCPKCGKFLNRIYQGCCPHCGYPIIAEEQKERENKTK